MWIFLIFAFLGWFIEIVIAKLRTGKFINCGFLKVPFCSIYGFGVAAMFVWLAPVRNNFLITFVLAALLASAIELLTGYALEKFFNKKWWDYSKEKFNLEGHICLRTSLIWGLACMIIIYVFQPLIDRPVRWLSGGVGSVIAALIIMTIIFDTVITVTALLSHKPKNK